MNQRLTMVGIQFILSPCLFEINSNFLFCFNCLFLKNGPFRVNGLKFKSKINCRKVQYVSPVK